MNRPVDNLNEIVDSFNQGTLSRRRFLTHAMAIGLSGVAATSLLGACSSSGSPSKGGTSGAAATETGGASGGSSGKRLKAALVTPQKTGDLGPVDAMVAGLKKGGADFNFETQVVEVVQGEYLDAAQSLAAKGYDLILGAFPPMTDTLVSLAPKYKDKYFANIIGQVTDTVPNLKAVWENGSDNCFLLSALGALYTKTGKIGTVMNTRNPEMDRFLAGYSQGYKLTNKNAKFSFTLVGGQNPFEDPSSGNRVANLLHEQGADVVFCSGGQTSQGVLQAAAQSNGGFVATGMDTDQCLQHPDSTLASGRIYEGSMVYSVMEEVHNGKFTPGTSQKGIIDGGDDICTFDDSKPEGHQDPQIGHKVGPSMAPEVRAMLWDLRAKIRSGELKVSQEVTGIS